MDEGSKTGVAAKDGMTVKELLKLVNPTMGVHPYGYECGVEGCNRPHQLESAIEIAFNHISGGRTDFPDYPVFYPEVYGCPGCEMHYMTQEEANDCCRYSLPMWGCGVEGCVAVLHYTLARALACMKGY